jgi:hypothetical protein
MTRVVERVVVLQVLHDVLFSQCASFLPILCPAGTLYPDCLNSFTPT